MIKDYTAFSLTLFIGQLAQCVFLQSSLYIYI